MRHRLVPGLVLLLCLLAPFVRDATAENPVPGMAQPTHWKATRPIGRGLGPVTDALLRGGAVDPTAWLQYGGDYRAWRHSPVKQLTPASVPQLRVAWAFQTGVSGQLEANPIVYDGILYLTSAHNRLFALDAKTGEVLWRYDHPSPPDLAICCGPANRGVAIAGDLVLMATLDAHLIAFQRKTGEIAWDTTIIDYKQGYSATAAPSWWATSR
jgi:glucose dehydrogenase